MSQVLARDVSCGVSSDRPAPDRDPRNDDLAVAGWISAVTMPSAGLLIGGVLRSRDDGRGRAIMAMSALTIVVAVAAFALLALR